MTQPALHSIGLIGAGAVGQSVATALCTSQLSERLLIGSRTREQARALAADIEDLRETTRAATRPQATTVTAMHACQAIVIAARAAFTNTARTDVRMAGAAANTPVILRLAHQLRGYQGTILVVTNPVDLMTRLLADTSGCTRVYGIGSNLDSARYRSTVARHLAVDPAAVHGHVIGEHGDGAVICASTTTVHGHPANLPLDLARAELTGRSGRISSGIGRTRCGPAGAVLTALRKSTGTTDGTEELSTPDPNGVYLGQPVSFTSGRPTVRMPALDTAEQEQWNHTRDKLHAAYLNLTDHRAPRTDRNERTPA